MVWNWYTVDACFISSTWRVTSKGMFAGSCIGVICLVISLDFLRRLQREYDLYVAHQLQYQHVHASSDSVDAKNENDARFSGKGVPKSAISIIPHLNPWSRSKARGRGSRPGAFQQFVRALIHTLQFAVAYFIMLLAMYFNGYVIICILIGAFLGSYVFSREIMGSNE